MKKDTDIITAIVTILIVILIILLMGLGIAIADYVKEDRQLQPIADTTKVQVLFEDTWGKIILIKEEDL